MSKLTKGSALKYLLPPLILFTAIAVGFVLVVNKPQPQRHTPVAKTTTVEAQRLQSQEFTLFVKSRGTVAPSTQSTLIPQVAGRIIKISTKFRDGGFFEKGDILLQIDPRDYRIAIAVTQAQLAQAELAVEEEKARGEVAMRQWRKLKPTQLALRKPHLQASRAVLASANAQLQRAKLDLQRTKIRAPYAGRVLQQKVDLGQYVAPGTVLARVYAIDFVEIRLPLSNLQLEYVQLPEHYRDVSPGQRTPQPLVRIRARIGRSTYAWSGKIVRTEGAIDTQSRQLFVVAQIDDPYSKGPAGRPPLRVGQFVEAKIQGKRLQQVFVIPTAAVRQNDEVLIVEAGRLQTRRVDVVWRNENVAVISAGLQEQELLSLTHVAGAVAGLAVTVQVKGNSAAEQNRATASIKPPAKRSSDLPGDRSRSTKAQ